MQNQPEKTNVPNRLIKEKSPYLLQHAFNPVDWYPWGDEAFVKAKTEDKPVFVSIGYSSCHWCHVIEQECFSDTQVAELMNQTFICIKVDREERPDIDSVYMAACQAMGRSCGWPLNVIMTPDKNPFFVASYIPKQSRYGIVGMIDLIPQISQIYKARRSEMETLGKEVNREISRVRKITFEGQLGKGTLDDAYEQLTLRFDTENGGFGDAPKFPSVHNLLFLLRYWNRTKIKNALFMVEQTLQAMRLGGIFDQIGFGFHRYSTDAMWLVPHFEKMLYDQAMLTLAYVEAYLATGNEQYKSTAKETLDYALRDMCSHGGSFYSAEDADMEGEEGKFYLWTWSEIKAALPPQDADLALKLFDVKPQGNYYEPNKGYTGKNILHMSAPIGQLAAERGIPAEALADKIEEIRKALFQFREKRVRPAKDDKVLVDWNGLMIAALAKAGQAFGEQKYIVASQIAADFVLDHLQLSGGLYHRYAKGEWAIEGFLDDYAYFSFGLIELYQATFKEQYLHAALRLTKTLLERFLDENVGGFYFTTQRGDNTFPRIKQAYDGAVPSGNAVALLNLLKLARLSGESKIEETARSLLSAFGDEVKINPLAHTFMLVGLDFSVGSAFNVVLVGEPQDQGMSQMIGALQGNFIPNLTVSLQKPNSFKGYLQIGGKATAYVCQNQTCLPPTNDLKEMLKQLGLPA